MVAAAWSLPRFLMLKLWLGSLLVAPEEGEAEGEGAFKSDGESFEPFRFLVIRYRQPLLFVFVSHFSFPKDNSDTPPSTSGSPTSPGFNVDRLPHNTSRITDSYSDDDEAAVDPRVFVDDDGGDGDRNKAEEEGEDLFDDNYME
ncbi:hypothetical protein C4D60_Mb09t23170 [Musa balbisiana]|uniref:Uncharacterized protein n=1 Tax=Musa balbisiana TaxID=52838 RepID=A0A4S8IJ74_MUSBA|nr:hypothetical protein C4D60_Mb09t23170 [Musa balbisiana]